MEEQGSPCPHDPHSTRFKDHLLSLLPDWAEFFAGKDDALLMRAAVILGVVCRSRTYSVGLSPPTA